MKYLLLVPVVLLLNGCVVYTCSCPRQPKIAVDQSGHIDASVGALGTKSTSNTTSNAAGPTLNTDNKTTIKN